MTGSGPLDDQLLKTYLSDHAAGAAAMINRVQRMARVYDDPDLSVAMERFAVALTLEREWLLRLTRRNGLEPSGWKSIGTWVGERVARLKPNGMLRTSPLSPLLDLELLGSGLRGKRSIWLTLQVWADEAGADRAHLDQFLLDVDEQIRVVEELLAKTRPTALAR